MAVVIEQFQSRIKNTLSFVRVRFPSGLVIAEIGMHVANGRAWASPPSRQMVELNDRDGAARQQRKVPLATAYHLQR